MMGRPSDYSLPKHIGDTHMRLLRIFKSVVESGSFASAEIALNISRPAISQSLTDLERLLNMTLCQRSRAGFSLTDSGQAVYDAILKLFTHIESFRMEIQSINEILSGELVIGITDNLVTFEHMHVTHALAQLKQISDQITLNIHMLPSLTLETQILEGYIDIGVLPKQRTLHGLDYRPLYCEHSYLYCAAEHPLFDSEVADTLEHDIREFEAVSHHYPESAEAKRMQQLLNITARANGREGVAFLILTGDYLGFLPSHYAESWCRQGKLKPIHTQAYHYSTDYALVSQKSGRHSKVRDAFMAICDQHISDPFQVHNSVSN